VGDLLRARDCTRHHLPRGCPVAPSWPLQSVPPGAVVQSPPPPARQPCTISTLCTGIYQRIHRLQYESRETGETAALLCCTN
jgi:hypothetical protein